MQRGNRNSFALRTGRLKLRKNHKGFLAMTKPDALHSFADGRPTDLEIVFSSRDGYIWASWQGSEMAVKLGRHDMVAAMMRDFLAQDALAQRLCCKALLPQDWEPAGRDD